MEIGKDLLKAKKILEKGGLVGIPTETVYGLAANGFCDTAVVRIFEAKKRPHFNPLILHTDSLEKIGTFVTEVPPLARFLAQKFWPGPLTLILKPTAAVPALVTAGLPTVAVRIPNHPLTLSLLSMLDFPLAAPSANSSGYISPTKPTHLLSGLHTPPSYVLDGGTCQVGLESTIVLPQKEKIIILRQGGLPIEKFENLGIEIDFTSHSASPPQAPGMLSRHYSPHTPIFLGNIADLLKQQAGKKVGILSFKTDYSAAAAATKILSRQGDLSEAARQLFAALRALDGAGTDVILAEPVPNKALGIAINDRLRRAAVPKQ